MPAAWQASQIRLDTDLKRLLPADSRAVRWSRELEATVGDGGYLSMILEGDDPKALDRAVDEAARLAGSLPDVGSVEYRVPVEFVRRYKYMLLPSRRMEELLDRVNQLETQVNPLVEDLLEPEPGPQPEPRADAADIDRELSRWLVSAQLQERRRPHAGGARMAGACRHQPRVTATSSPACRS